MATVTPQYVRTDEPWIPADTFGSRLAQLRQALGWNVEQAAAACGLVGQTWRNWEDGKTPRDILAVVHQIAEATNVSERWLLVGDAQNWKLLNTPDLQVLHGAGESTPEATARPTLRVVR